jgi:hypothetical protein
VTNPAPTAGPSNSVAFTGTPAGPGVQLVVASVDAGGNVVNGSGVISSTGEFVAFFQDQSGYVRDTCLGGSNSCKPSTTLYAPVVNSPNLGPVTALGVSSQGRYVSYAFTPEGFIDSETQLDVVDTCFQVSSSCAVSTVGSVPSVSIGSGNVVSVPMTPDGRYIGYGLQGTTYTIPFPANLFDTCLGAPSGCTQTSIRVANTATAAPVPSANGRYLVYANIGSQIVLQDSCLGAAPGCAPLDTVESGPTTGLAPTISSDAQYIAWIGTISLGSSAPLYLQATCLNSPSGCSTTPSQITSLAGPRGPVWVSTGGRFVAYQGPDGTVNLYDSCHGGPSGCTPQTIPISVNASGALANSPAFLEGMSSDGKYILFSSGATNLLTTVPTNLSNVSYIALNPLF